MNYIAYNFDLKTIYQTKENLVYSRFRWIYSPTTWILLSSLRSASMDLHCLPHVWLSAHRTIMNQGYMLQLNDSLLPH